MNFHFETANWPVEFLLEHQQKIAKLPLVRTVTPVLARGGKRMTSRTGSLQEIFREISLELFDARLNPSDTNAKTRVQEFAAGCAGISPLAILGELAFRLLSYW